MPLALLVLTGSSCRRKIPHLKYMGKKGDDQNLKSSFRIALKNLKKFVVIDHEKMYLHAYFHIFLSSRVLKIKNFLTIDFSPCYLNGKLRPFGRLKSVELDPLIIWNIFYYFFRNFLHGDTDEKVDLGNKERPNIYAYMHMGR